MNHNAQFNMRGLGENRAENIQYFIPQMKLQEESIFVYFDFDTLLKMYCYAKQC